MPEFSTSPEQPATGEPTDAELARYMLARGRELQRLADHLGNERVTRLIREAMEKTQEFLDSDSSSVDR